MNWNDYRNAVDRLPFSDDFQERTEKLLCRHIQETSEKERIAMRRKPFMKIAAAAAVFVLLTASAYAAVRAMSPSQAAEFAGQPLLAQAFERGEGVVLNESVETGDYRVTLAGLVSGRGLDSWNQQVDQARTYAIVALERLDGAALSNPDFPFMDYTLTPLVKGFAPWAVNNWTLDASAQGFDRDGFYYYLLDVQNLEMFADHTVYLAFYEGGVPSRETFRVEDDGTIAFAEGLEGPHALFTLPLDDSKADPAAVDAFMDESGFDREWFTGTVSEGEEPSFDINETGTAEEPLFEILEVPGEPEWAGIRDAE